MSEWAGRHKFWVAMIILFFIGVVLTWLGLVNGAGFGRFLGNLVGIYLFLWVLNRVTRKKEKEEVKENYKVSER